MQLTIFGHLLVKQARRLNQVITVLLGVGSICMGCRPIMRLWLGRLTEGGCTAVVDRRGVFAELERVGDLLYQAPEVQRACPGSKIFYTPAGVCSIPTCGRRRGSQRP